MSKYIRRAVAMMEAARPASGHQPQSDEELQKALLVGEELSYAIFREGGMPEKKARALAHYIYNGEPGKSLLQFILEERGND